MTIKNAGYVAQSDFANTALQQAALTDASLKRLMAAGFTQGVPNVARLTGVNVAKRTLAPTRMVALQIATAVGGDFIADLDAAIVGLIGLPAQIWSNQNAQDREQTEGDYIGGMQVDVSVVGTVPAAGGVQSNLWDGLEQAIGEFYGIAIFPSSGNQSPLVANTPLREFAQTHRLSGPDGYRGVPPVRWSDNFAHIDLQVSDLPVGALLRPSILNTSGAIVDWTVSIVVRLRTFAG